MSRQPIQVLSKELFDTIVRQRSVRGKFLCLTQTREGMIYIEACDNETGDAWTECFLSVNRAIAWLRGGTGDFIA
jgi:hypothetical protein